MEITLTEEQLKKRRAHLLKEFEKYKAHAQILQGHLLEVEHLIKVMQESNKEAK